MRVGVEEGVEEGVERGVSGVCGASVLGIPSCFQIHLPPYSKRQSVIASKVLKSQGRKS